MLPWDLFCGIQPTASLPRISLAMDIYFIPFMFYYNQYTAKVSLGLSPVTVHWVLKARMLKWAAIPFSMNTQSNFTKEIIMTQIATMV